jgi:hypothetical protein
MLAKAVAAGFYNHNLVAQPFLFKLFGKLQLHFFAARRFTAGTAADKDMCSYMLHKKPSPILFLFYLAYNKLLHYSAVNYVFGNNFFNICRFYFAVGNARFSGPHNIHQHFFFAHADAAGLLHLHIRQMAYSQFVKHCFHYFARTGSNAAGAHADNNFGSAVLTDFNIVFQLFP